MHTRFFLAVAATVLGLGGAAHGVSVRVITNDADGFTTDSFASDATSGAQMTGIEVTGTTSAGTSTGTWAATGFNSGGMSGTGFALSQSGLTGQNPWTLTVNDGYQMTGLMLDGLPGTTVFDIDDFFTRTPGTSYGREFEPLGAFDGLSGRVIATYSGIVSLTGASPQDDVFTRLTLDFTGLTGGSLGAGSWMFYQDTDTPSLNSPILPINPGTPPVNPGPPVSAVPLPAPALLLIAGILGTGTALRKRRKATG